MIAATMLLPSGIVAQNTQRGIVEAVIGSDLNSVLPDDVVYMYPEFQKGTILFQDRGTADGIMNIYLLGSDVHFIDPKGDTLVLKDQDSALMLSIGHDSYIRYNKFWIRIIAARGPYALGIRSMVNIDQAQKIGAYGMADATSSISNVGRISDIQNQSTATDAYGNAYGSSSSVYLKTLRNVPYSVSHDAMLYDGNKFYIANRRNFSRVFPGKIRWVIKDYIEENDLDLNNVGDVLKLFNFLSL